MIFLRSDIKYLIAKITHGEFKTESVEIEVIASMSRSKKNLKKLLNSLAWLHIFTNVFLVVPWCVYLFCFVGGKYLSLCDQ